MSFIVCPSLFNAQEPLWKRILSWLAADQNAFVESFLADDIRKPHVVDRMTGVVEYRERNSALSTLMMNNGDPFIPLFEAKIRSEMKSHTSDSDEIILRAAEGIVTAGTERALESIERLFRDDKPRFKRFLPPVLSSGFSQDGPRTVLKWYKALESATPELREAAIASVQEIYVQGRAGADFLLALGEAMSVRYGHVPEGTDFKNDPIIIAIELRSMTIAYETRRKVLELSDQIRRNKEQGTKKQ